MLVRKGEARREKGSGARDLHTRILERKEAEPKRTPRGVAEEEAVTRRRPRKGSFREEFRQNTARRDNTGDQERDMHRDTGQKRGQSGE
jgi:hypothetical protein